MFRNFIQALASGVTAVLGGRDSERSGPHDDFEHVGETVESDVNESEADASLAEEAAAVDSHNTSGTCVDTKRRKIRHVEEAGHKDEAWEKVEKENRSEVTAHSEAEPGNVNTNAVQPPRITQDMSLIGSQSELCTSALGNHSELSTSAFEEIQVPQKESEDLNPDLNSSGSIEVISTETVSEVKVSMTDTLVITDSMIFNSASDEHSDATSGEKEKGKSVKEDNTKTVEEEEVFEDSFENLDLLMEAAGHSECVKAKNIQDNKTEESKEENSTKSLKKPETEAQDAKVVDLDKNASVPKEKGRKKDDREAGRPDRESHKPIIQWEEGEHYLDFVKRKTEARQLIYAKKFIYKLGYLTDITTAQLEEAVIEQYKIAVQKKFTDWIKECRYHGEILFSRKWLDENVPMPGRKAKQTDWKQRKNRNTYKSEWSYKPGEMCRDVRLETNPNLPVYRTNAATKVENVEGAKEDTAERVLKEQSESLKEDLGSSVEKKEDVEEIKAEGNKESKKGEVKMPEIKLAATKDEEFGKKGSEDSVSEREVEVAVKVSCESENVMATAQCVKEKTEATGTVEKGLRLDENKKNNSDVKESEDEFKDECSLINENAVKEVESKVYENEPVCSNEGEVQKKPSEGSVGKTSPEELKEKRIENESRISKAGKKGVDQNDKKASESSTNGEDEKEQKDSDQKDSFKSDDETKAEEKRELDKAKWDEAMDGWIQATRKGRKARSRGVSENDGQLVSHHVAASGDGNKHSSSTENVSDSVTDYESLLADWKKDSEKHQLKKRNSDSGEESLVKTPTSAEKKPRTFVSKTINSPNSPFSYAAAVTGDSPPEGMRGSKEQKKECGEKISSSPVNAVGREIGRSIETCKEDTKVKSSSNGGKKELLENSDSAGQFCSKGKEDRVANVELNDLDISDAEREVSKLVSEITSKVLAEAETEAGVLEEQIMRENSSKEVQDSRDIPFEDSAIISEGRKLCKAPEGMSLPLASLERGAEESERSNSPEEFISLLQQVMPNISLSGMKPEHSTDSAHEPMSKVVVQEDMANCVDIGDLSVAENVEVGEDGASKTGLVVAEKGLEEVGKEEIYEEDCISPGVILSSEMHHYGKTENAARGVTDKTGPSRIGKASKNDGKQSSKHKEKPHQSASSGKVSSTHGSGASYVPVPHSKSSRVSSTPGKGGSQRKPSVYEEKGRKRETEKPRKHSGSKEQPSLGKSKVVAKEETRSRYRSGDSCYKYTSGVAKSEALRKKSSSSADRAKDGKERKDSSKGRSANDYPGSPHLKSTFSSRMKSKDITDKQSNSTNDGNQTTIVDREEQKVCKEIPLKEDKKKVDGKEKLQQTKPYSEKKSSRKDGSSITDEGTAKKDSDKEQKYTEKKPATGDCFVKLEKLSSQTVEEYARERKKNDDTTQMKKGSTDTSEKEASHVVPRRKSDPLIEKSPLETILNVSNLIEMIKEKKEEISLIKHGYGQRIIGGKMMRKKSVSESELDTVFGRMKRKGDMNIRRSSLSTAFGKTLKELKQSVNIGKKSETYGLHKRRGSLLYTLEQDFGSSLYEVKTAKDLVKHKEDLKETREVELQDGLGTSSVPGFHEYNLSLDSQNLAGKEVHVQDERLKEEVKELTAEDSAKTDINSNRLAGERPSLGHEDSAVTLQDEKDGPDIGTGCPKAKSKTSSKVKTTTSSSGAKAKVTNVKASRKHQWRQSKK